MSSISVIFSVCRVFTGCGLNVIFLELLTNKFPSSGNLITFAQFIFISIERFIFGKFYNKRRIIPLNILNNYALNFNIPMPLHIIIRSGSLVANILMGLIILKKRYKINIVLSIIMITIGIICFTFASVNDMGNGLKLNQAKSPQDIRILFIGVSLLIVSLFLSAITGLYQEKLYARFGRESSKEALFYSHALPLPGFLIIYSDLLKNIALYNDSDKIHIFTIRISVMWCYLVMNVITQYLCIRSVFWMTSIYTSLTVTLILTLRKFLSLFISIIYFGFPFNLYHVFGAILVILGTLLFYDWPLYIIKRSLSDKKSQPPHFGKPFSNTSHLKYS